MFTLYDGRTQLYQWDLNRKIIVEDTKICEVHFCNRTSDCSLVVEPYYIDNVYVADIPNILLQDARPIRVYAYVDDEYTLTEEQFSVKSRTRPADYVYTETEVLQYSTMDARMSALEENLVSTVEEEVKSYLTENPVEVDLTEYYTKSEVDTALENVSVDLTGYATEDFVSNEISTVMDNFNGLATEDYVSQAIEDIVIPEPDLSGYATEEYVQEQINSIEIPTQDLTGYATEEFVDNAVADVMANLNGLASEEYVDNAIANVSVGDITIAMSDDGEGNVTLVGGTIPDGEEVQY